jgi:hypothetical protein
MLFSFQRSLPASTLQLLVFTWAFSFQPPAASRRAFILTCFSFAVKNFFIFSCRPFFRCHHRSAFRALNFKHLVSGSVSFSFGTSGDEARIYRTLLRRSRAFFTPPSLFFAQDLELACFWAVDRFQLPSRRVLAYNDLANLIRRACL